MKLIRNRILARASFNFKLFDGIKTELGRTWIKVAKKTDRICKISSHCQACLSCRESEFTKYVFESVSNICGHVFNSTLPTQAQKVEFWAKTRFMGWRLSDQFILISFFIGQACHHISRTRDTKVHPVAY